MFTERPFDPGEFKARDHSSVEEGPNHKPPGPYLNKTEKKKLCCKMCQVLRANLGSKSHRSEKN